jgi:hypothetical protein
VLDALLDVQASLLVASGPVTEPGEAGPLPYLLGAVEDALRLAGAWMRHADEAGDTGPAAVVVPRLVLVRQSDPSDG